MTLVQGELRLVTDTPAEVSQVWVQASEERLHGTGMVTTGRASEQVTNGVVSFDALPGAAVMVLLVNGIPSTTVKLLIPNKANATLRECIEASWLADDGTLDALENLSLEVAEAVSHIGTLAQLGDIATQVRSDADRAELNAGLAGESLTATQGVASDIAAEMVRMENMIIEVRSEFAEDPPGSGLFTIPFIDSI